MRTSSCCAIRLFTQFTKTESKRTSQTFLCTPQRINAFGEFRVSRGLLPFDVSSPKHAHQANGLTVQPQHETYVGTERKAWRRRAIGSKSTTRRTASQEQGQHC